MAATTVKADLDNAIRNPPRFLVAWLNMTDPMPDLYRFHRDDSLLLRYPTA
jgi:hypothetical protein